MIAPQEPSQIDALFSTRQRWKPSQESMDKANDMAQQVESYVRSHPGTSIATAVAVGFS